MSEKQFYCSICHSYQDIEGSHYVSTKSGNDRICFNCWKTIYELWTKDL